MSEPKIPQKRRRTKAFVARSLKRNFFLYQGRLIHRDEAKTIVSALINRGMPHIKIQAELSTSQLVYSRLLKEITDEQLLSVPDSLRFAIVSEHPFPRDLADESIMARLQGPWLHAAHLGDTGIDEIRKRVVAMGDDYGWVRIVRIVPVDQQTLVDNHGVLI